MSHAFFEIDESILALAKRAEEACAPQFARIEQVTEYNQNKVLKAFIQNRIGEQHLLGSTGYGYGDVGREALDKTFAAALGAEAALVRHHFTCGTHTLGVALFGILRPGDTLLCVSGTPYDTIQPVIGIHGEGMGSLKDFGVHYEEVALKEGRLDFEAMETALKEMENVKMVYVQRSRGYDARPTLTTDEIAKIAELTHRLSKAIVFVDNCYGEFTDFKTPTEAGADLMAGSLIKNPGGGIARTGGYIAGKKELVELCAYRATVPGLGAEVGAGLDENRNMFMGLFAAPHVTGEALKTAVFAAAVFEQLGYTVSPASSEERYDIIQCIQLGTAKALAAFCRGVQSGAPIDSYVVPEAWDMPGYEDKVIMAAGAFISGASIEFSADGPMREPYCVWMQGGLNYHSAKTGILLALQQMKEAGEIGI
ncbi:MAG: methionine gamma-lyase family protein [Clostridia bacterium]|nr:methionine gamma-lyase family protein [Clostridia bacterium]